MKKFARLKKNLYNIYKDIYKYIYIEPSDLEPLIDSPDDWYMSNKFIPHALGAVDNYSYTNSREALENLQKNHIKVSEVDINLTKDNIPVLSHNPTQEIDFNTFMASKIENKFTPLSLADLIEVMRKDKDFFFLLDLKCDPCIAVQWIKDNASDVIDRFIIQVGSPEIYGKIIKIHKFKYFHYNFSLDGNLNFNLRFVVKNKLQTCSIACKNLKNSKTLEYLNKYNVKAFVYTVNTQEQKHMFKRRGAWGIMSDDLAVNAEDNSKKRILIVAGHSRSPWKWGMVGEAVKRLQEDPANELYFLDCHGKLPGYCGLSCGKHPGYCKKCYPKLLTVLEKAGFDKKNIIEIEKLKTEKFPDFNTVAEALAYSHKGFHLGLGPVSCIMTITRDCDFNIKKWNGKVKKFFNTVFTVAQNIENLQAVYNFNEICTFNGRMPFVFGAVSFCKKYNIPFTTFEDGANVTKLRALKNTVPHDFYSIKKEIVEYWDQSGEDRNELAIKWFQNKRKGEFQAMESFTKDQQKDLLPADFDPAKENIAYFNSSMDEVLAFESWQHPFAKTENEVIFAMLEHYKDDDSKHFYLRIHPNLTKAKKKKTTQMRELNAIRNKYKNLTIIDPDEKVDTYALMEACDKVLAAYSTAGCEATYYGKVSILAGKGPYEDTGCVYQAGSMEEFFELIDNKDLQPKPKETAYPYGYWNQVYGEKFRYYKPENHSKGDFLGLELKEK